MRHTADTITDDALEALYRRIETLEHVAAGNKRHVQLVVPDLEKADAAIERVRAYAHELRHKDAMGLLAALDEQPGPAATEATQTETTARVFAGLHRSAEETVTRVIALHEQWVKAGPPPLGTLMSRWWDARLVELHNAILPPTT